MNSKKLERLVGNLQDIMRCPHCSNKYSTADIHYLGQLDTMTFLHMRCPGCQTPVFASIATATDGGDLLPETITSEDIALADHSLAGYTESQTPTTEELGFEYKKMKTQAPERNIPIEALPAEKIMAALTPVVYDDVLDMNAYLKDFTGDFEQLA